MLLSLRVILLSSTVLLLPVLSLRVILLSSTVLLLPVLSLTSSGSSSSAPIFQHVSVISSEQIQELIESPSVSVLYFYVKDSQNVREFLEEFEKSAKYLKVYNITLAMYKCSGDLNDHEMCKQDNVDNNVYTYQNGAELLTFTLETMFDVNSIIANALQLLLLHQVPLIQSRKELHELQRNFQGNKISYFRIRLCVELKIKVRGLLDLGQKAAAFKQSNSTHLLTINKLRAALNERMRYSEIVMHVPGSSDRALQEHRIFLEIAYAFQDRFKFALTTEFKVTQSLQSSELLKPNMDFAMWVLFCVESTANDISMDGICQSVLYEGESSLTDLALFVKRLSEKTLYHVPADGLNEVFDMTDNLPIIFVYINKDVQDEIVPVSELAKFELRGLAKVVVVDMDNEDCRSLAEGQGFSGKLPALGFKEDGAMTFFDQSKQWSADNVQSFIRSIVYPSDGLNSGSPSEMTYPTDLESHSDISMLSDNVQKQDDQIAGAVLGLNKQEMELDHVPALLKHNFDKIVSSADLKVVLFYLPFDHISMAFLREFGFAALTLARNFSEPNVMARVNCYDGTDLCAAENITVYPVLRIYRRDQSSQDYKGSLDFRSVIKAVKLLRLNSPIQLTSEEEVQRFMKGKHPQIFQNFTTSSVLYLTSAEETEDEQVFYNVAKSLSIITAFGVVHGDLSKSIAATYNVPVPSVVALHRNDPNQPIRVLNEKISELSLTDFVKNSLIASLPELTVMNLPTLYARRQPFAILFLDLSDQESMVTKETLTKLSTSGHFDNVIFCWMNAQAKTMGHKILSEYTWTATLPMMTVVNHEQGELFNYQPEQLTIEDTSEWLTRVVTKKVRPSKMLEYSKWVAPGPHYDFLDMIDEMEKQKAGALANDVWLQAEQHKRDQKTLGIPSAEADQEETQNIDREMREELLELQKSRIYSTSSKRQGGNIKQHLAASEPPPSRTHPHVEL